jgi:hypothetical protein
MGYGPFTMKRGAPKERERGRLGLGRVLGRGKATMRAPRVEEDNPPSIFGAWG